MTRYMTGTEHNQMMACYEYVKAALVAEQDKRNTYSDLGWIEAERATVATAANDWADSHGFDRPTMNTIEATEQSANGHSDYTHKWCLGVARAIVWGEQP